MRSNSCCLHFTWGALALLALAVPGTCQTTQTTKSVKTTSSTTGEYAIFDVTLFGGYQRFNVFQDSKYDRGRDFATGPIFGLRFTEDFSRRLGLEESLTYGINNLRLRPYQTNNWAGFGNRNYQFAITPVFHFTPRQSRVRPFLLAGPAIVYYDPTRDAELSTRTAANASLHAQPLEMKYGPALVYGGGVKFNMRRIGVRFDVRSVLTQTPHFNLTTAPTIPGSVFIGHRGIESALQATFGIVFKFGMRSDSAATVASTEVTKTTPPPPPPPAPVVEIQLGAIQGGTGDVCAGDPVALSVTASGWPSGQSASYQWMVNGQAAPGGSGPTFNLSTQGASGAQTVTVTVSAAGASKTSEPLTIRIKDSRPPTVTVSASPSTIAYGEKSTITGNATGSDCGGPATIKYTASEGTISGNIFDSTGVSFDMNNRSRQQTKTVTITATATDTKGATGTATTNIVVTMKPAARRLDDIIFPNGSSRVNNCAKRVLLEDLTAMLRDDPNGRVILVGHRDSSEKGKGFATLDRDRVLNAAAVLSAGTGICPQLDLSRIKVDWVGADQTTPTKASLCGSSTTVKEKGGQAIGANDQKAQFRRVEIWFVPGGADAPSQVRAPKDAPASLIKAKGCPK
jgi:Flagellar motor protein